MSIANKMSGDLFRTILLTMLAGVAVLIVALSNRNVYSKEAIDARFSGLEAVEDVRYETTSDRIEQIAIDVRWLVREWGGTPSADTYQDYRASQPDSGR